MKIFMGGRELVGVVEVYFGWGGVDEHFLWVGGSG